MFIGGLTNAANNGWNSNEIWKYEVLSRCEHSICKG